MAIFNSKLLVYQRVAVGMQGSFDGLRHHRGKLTVQFGALGKALDAGLGSKRG